MIRLVMQVRWLMIMSQVRSWSEFMYLNAVRYFIKSGPFLQGMITASNIMKFVRVLRNRRR